MVRDGMLKANLKKNSGTDTLFLLQWCCTYWNLYFLTSSSLIPFSNSVPCILPYPLKCCTRYPAKTYFGKNFKQHCWSHSLAYSNSFVVWVVLNQDLLQFMYGIYSCRNLLVFEHFFACNHLNATAVTVRIYERWLTVNGAGSVPYCKHIAVIFIYILRSVNILTHITFPCKNLKARYSSRIQIKSQGRNFKWQAVKQLKSFSERTIIPEVHRHRMLWTLMP